MRGASRPFLPSTTSVAGMRESSIARSQRSGSCVNNGSAVAPARMPGGNFSRGLCRGVRRERVGVGATNHGGRVSRRP